MKINIILNMKIQIKLNVIMDIITNADDSMASPRAIRKRVDSRAHHAEMQRCREQGVPEQEMKRRCRLAAALALRDAGFL